MPDAPPDHGRAAELSLVWAAGVFLVAGVIAFVTGDEVVSRGGSVRTHTDAVWVLVSLSVAAFGAAFFVSDAKRPR